MSDELKCGGCPFLTRDLQWEEWDCICPTRPEGKSGILSIRRPSPDWCPRRRNRDRLLKPRGWNRAMPIERAMLEAGCTCQSEGFGGTPTEPCPIHSIGEVRRVRSEAEPEEPWQVERILERLEQLSNECPGAGASGMTPVAAARQAYLNAMRVVRHGGR